MRLLQRTRIRIDSGERRARNRPRGHSSPLPSPDCIEEDGLPEDRKKKETTTMKMMAVSEEEECAKELHCKNELSQ